MPEKRTDIIVRCDVAAGFESRQVRYFERDRNGAEVPVDEMREFPIVEARTMTIPNLTSEEAAALTDDALTERVRTEFGPQTRLTGVEHKTYYV